MNRSLSVISLLLALAVTATFALPAQAEFQEQLEAARMQAAEEGKLVLIDFYAVWCGPCKRFTQASHEDADLMADLENYVVVKVDAEKADGVDLAKKHSIQGYPTFVVTNTEGVTLDRWMGYDKDHFLEHSMLAQADPTTMDEKMARYEATPTEKDAAKIADYYASTGEYDKAIAHYEAAAKLNPGSERSYDYATWEATLSGARDDLYTAGQVQAAADKALQSDLITDMDAMILATEMNGMAKSTGHPEAATPYLKQVMARTENSEDAGVRQYRQRMMPDYAMLVEKDPAKAVEYKRAGMPEGWTEDPAQLNSFAWWCFENRVNLDEAQKLAEKGAELAPAGADRAMILDTVAEICNARGDCKDAVAWIQKAIENDPNRQYFAKQLERFEKELAEQQADD